MPIRSDGSYQSANTPTFANTGKFKEDYNLYRCMVTKVIYVDDDSNITKNSQNPEVIYECVILGGYKEGQKLTNVRLCPSIGGDDNYSEMTLTPASKPITDTRLADQDGDIVMVEFIQSQRGYPVIVAFGNSLNAAHGATKATGPKLETQYNGLNYQINNAGELTITRKGGSLDASTGRFKPVKSMDSSISLKKNQLITITTKGGTTITVDGANDIIKLLTAGGGELNIVKGKVAFGASGTELLQQISDTLDKIKTFMNSVDSTHDHIGNLGYPTSPPETASQFTQLGSDLGDIKSKVDGIKGSL
jgi:hypothetical protein